MRNLYCLIVFIWMHFACYAQKPFDFNQGGTANKSYYIVLPYENVMGKIIVPVDIHGKKYRFIFDTGASNLVSESVAKEFSFPSLCKLPIADANGKVDSVSIVSANIKLGDVAFNNIPSGIFPDTSLFFRCYNVDGFIGSNMLRNSIVRFSSIDRTIIVTDLESKLSLHKKTSSTLKLSPLQSRPFIQVKIKNDKSAKTELLFDSGMKDLYSISQYDYSVQQKKNIFNMLNTAKGTNGISMHGVSDEGLLYRLRLPELNINGAILQNVSLCTNQGGVSAIGVELLDYGTVTIDFINKRFYFEPFKPSVNLYKKQFQIDPIIKNDEFFVGVVWSDGLKNEIAVGDQILKIDTLDCEKINPCDYLAKPSPFKNRDSLTLTLKSKTGQIKVIKIEKE